MSEEYPAGWYDDPKTPNQERYWDGTGWTHDVRESFPPGWYDDPDRFLVQRYWDGGAWTDERRFVTRLDDVFQPLTLRKKDYRLVVSGEILQWENDSMRWDDMTDFDTLTRVANDRRSPMAQVLTITGKDRRFTMEMNQRGLEDVRTQEAFNTIVDTAHRLLTPRILNDLFRRGDAGEIVEYAKVAFSPQGFSKAGKDDAVPWPEYGGWQNAGQLFTINRMKGDKAKKELRFNVSLLGRWILTALLDDYSRRFSNAAAQ